MAEKNLKQADLEAVMAEMTKAFDVKLTEALANVGGEMLEKCKVLINDAQEESILIVMDKVDAIVHEARDLGDVIPAELAEHIPEPLSRDEITLIEEALDAYGIENDFVLNTNIDRPSGEVVIVTNGGAKVRFKSGQKVTPLKMTQVTGVNQETADRRVVAGHKAKKK